MRGKDRQERTLAIQRPVMKEAVKQRREECQRDFERKATELVSENEEDHDDQADENDEDSEYEEEVLEESEGFGTGEDDSAGPLEASKWLSVKRRPSVVGWLDRTLPFFNLMLSEVSALDFREHCIQV